MIDKALIAIQSTGLFEIAVLEWNGFDAMNQTWPEFKEHFAEAYDSRLASGAGTASQNGYHNAYNAVDDDSIGSIKESLAGLQMANNANCQQLNDNLSAITQESRDLRAQLVACQQQVAMLARIAPMPGAPAPWQQAPTVAPYMPPTTYLPPPAAYAAVVPPIPTTIYQPEEQASSQGRG